MSTYRQRQAARAAANPNPEDPPAKRRPVPPLVTIRHPLKFAVNHVQTLSTGALLVKVGTLSVVGLYYLLFETWHPLTSAWHSLIPVSYDRHLVRDVAEGLFGAFLGQMVTWNAFKALKPARRLDRLEMALHIPNRHQAKRVSAGQLLASPLVAAVYAIPGFALGFLILKLVHSSTTVTSSYDHTVVGLFAGVFMARRPMKPVFQSIQTFFAERRVAKGHKPRLYEPPAFRALVNSHAATKGQLVAMKLAAARGKWVPQLLVGASVLTTALAAFGYYVLHVIATHH